MAYLDQQSLADDMAFQRRVKQAMLTAAIAVCSEDPATANHTARATYATKVLNAPDGYVEAFAAAIATNAAITSESVDGDIQFEVNSIWSAMAGT